MLKQERKNFIPPRNNNDLTGTLEKLIFGKKVSVFIDAANLYHSSSVAKLKIDFIQVIKWFKSHCKLKNANFYTAYDIEDQKQMEFLQDLEYNGYNMIKKPLKIFENSKKGNMDIEIAVDCFTQQNLYDIIILISGDGDFSYLMQTLERLGKQTVVIGVGGFTSYELHKEVNEYFFFNRIRSVWQAQKIVGDNIINNIPSVLLPKSTDPNSELQNVQKIVRPDRIDVKNNLKVDKKNVELKPVIKKLPKNPTSTPTIHL
ncbi:MAG: NYN domain-containing protein [candidate division SR1 bacterium]|nr:NYN domain-containing protein [candidate division SR1 bacterium]